VADPGFSSGGINMASVWSASLHEGLKAESPLGFGAKPLVGIRGKSPLKLAIF
jgi:hypothetical protein